MGVPARSPPLRPPQGHLTHPRPPPSPPGRLRGRPLRRRAHQAVRRRRRAGLRRASRRRRPRRRRSATRRAAQARPQPAAPGPPASSLITMPQRAAQRASATSVDPGEVAAVAHDQVRQEHPVPPPRGGRGSVDSPTPARRAASNSASTPGSAAASRSSSARRRRRTGKRSPSCSARHAWCRAWVANRTWPLGSASDAAPAAQHLEGALLQPDQRPDAGRRVERACVARVGPRRDRGRIGHRLGSSAGSRRARRRSHDGPTVGARSTVGVDPLRPGVGQRQLATDASAVAGAQLGDDHAGQDQ